jgi:ABC-2 type transport system ATP-binding protein
MTVMVEIDHISRSFGDFRAVDDISLTVRKGEVLGFLGPNGAGKTTTMRMIAGFLAPSSGTARVCGHDVVSDPTAVKSVIGYMPEGSPSYDDMTVGAFLKFIAEVRGFTGQERDARVDAAAARLDLRDVMERPIDILSKGYRRRVGLAQSILHDPPVLLLDEPTDGLDPNQKHHVRRLIAEMASEKAIIVSTHILEEVEAVCTRAVIIGRGKVLADGTAADLLARLPEPSAVCIIVPTEDAETIAAHFHNYRAVTSVTQSAYSQGRTRIRITAHDDGMPVEEVAQIVRARNFPAAEIYAERGNLDDVFRLITTGATAQAAE